MLPMEIELFDVASENWAFDVANENWIILFIFFYVAARIGLLMLPMKIELFDK